MVQLVHKRGWTMGCGVKVSNRIPTYVPIVEFLPTVCGGSVLPFFLTVSAASLFQLSTVKKEILLLLLILNMTKTDFFFKNVIPIMAA